MLHVPIVYPIVLSFVRVDEFDVEQFLRQIEKVLQSREELRLDEHALLHHVIHIQMPQGAWRLLRHCSSLAQSLLTVTITYTLL